MFPVLLPFGISLFAAIFSDLSREREQKRQRSIEVCTANCKATWLKEDGVLRVYQGTHDLACAQIVVEVDGQAPLHIPGNVEDHQVRIKMIPEGESFGATDADAAEKFLHMAEAHNRQIIEHQGQKIVNEGPGRSKIMLGGPPLTKREEMYLRYVGERFEVEPFVSSRPAPINASGQPTGTPTVHITFTKR